MRIPDGTLLRRIILRIHMPEIRCQEEPVCSRASVNQGLEVIARHGGNFSVAIAKVKEPVSGAENGISPGVQ